ncbi:putative peptidyl-tRNA hydrolase PTRHD1 [Vigna unguiculata]|uniref:putative peptidyl-tRNA hydrolase PTRHD1 n=1 Tax=Vigna unguiculata TaxID=3917 RepID=UPI001016B72F|nr:putative peptidyl-tRNA hydrolase PTRHD1 [Vigna unguiculata]
MHYVSACTVPLRLFTPSGSNLAFSTTRVRVTRSILTRPSQLKSNSMSQPAADLNAVAVATTNDGPQNLESADVVVQYVVLRRDLIDTWPLGSVITQGCHASVSAVWSNKDDPDTVDYCSPDKIDYMHKVTLEVKGETQIKNLSEKLTSGGIIHKLWIEQPENIPTCLATKPYPKSIVSSYFKKLKLCK